MPIRENIWPTQHWHQLQEADMYVVIFYFPSVWHDMYVVLSLSIWIWEIYPRTTPTVWKLVIKMRKRQSQYFILRLWFCKSQKNLAPIRDLSKNGCAFLAIKYWISWLHTHYINNVRYFTRLCISSYFAWIIKNSF